MEHRFIPLSVPNLKGREMANVTHAIEMEWVSTGGAYITEFEKQMAKYVKSAGAVACQSGTSGLHIALLLCGVSRGDEVLVPALTFIAAVNPVKYIGAEPVFLDCDDSLTIDGNKLLDFCTNGCVFHDGLLVNKLTGKHVRAIVVVHVFGNMAPMEEIMQIAHRFNLKVIEDATEALGTYYTEGVFQGKYAGTMGDVGVYSFNGNKIITTGGGGMIVSDNEEMLKRAKHLTTQAKMDEVYYTHDEIGYNYRMTNVQAAIGLAQLEQIEVFIETKGKNYRLYKEQIERVPGMRIMDFREGTRPNYWFYSLYCEEMGNCKRDGLIQALAARNVQSRPIWALINEQPPYQLNQTHNTDRARHYIQRIVNLPCSTNLSEEEVRYVVRCLFEMVEENV